MARRFSIVRPLEQHPRVTWARAPAPPLCFRHPAPAPLMTHIPPLPSYPADVTCSVQAPRWMCVLFKRVVVHTFFVPLLCSMSLRIMWWRYCLYATFWGWWRWLTQWFLHGRASCKQTQKFWQRHPMKTHLLSMRVVQNLSKRRHCLTWSLLSANPILLVYSLCVCSTQ